MVSSTFTKALNRYVRRVGQDEAHRYPSIMKREKVVAVIGKRYAKIVRMDKKRGDPRYSSAISFVDMQPGPMQGSVYIAASWSQPRKYHVDNILKPRAGVPGR